MKIGLVTIYQVPNYGSVLQAYATQTLIEQLGHECFVIRYKYPNELQIKGKKNIRQIVYLLTLKLGLTAQQRKICKLNKFKKGFFKFTRKFNSYSSLVKFNWDSYDILAVGSDQVWHTKYTNGEPAFLLKFLPDHKKRISIASSFASDILDQNFRELFQSELSKFSSITVREENGLKILSSLSLNSVPSVCLDPTLLLSKENWLEISEPITSSSYILLYMWTYAFEPRPYIFEVIRYFKERMGNCNVIALEGHCNIPDNIKDELQISCAEDSSIGQFVSLFSKAGLVITSSFHGSAFAINFQRPLISIVPNNSSDDRQTSLLKSVSANNCIVKVGQSIESINPYYDVNLVGEKLEIMRKSSIETIKSIIEK